MKARIDFVTNSSSSSFVLAAESKKDLVNNICEQYTGERLGQIIEDIQNKENQLTLDELIEKYRDENEYYPIRYNIQEKLKEEMGMSYKEFSQWEKDPKNKALEEEMIEKEMEKCISKLKDRAKGKDFIVAVEYEDHYPESELTEVCENSDDCIEVFSHH